MRSVPHVFFLVLVQYSTNYCIAANDDPITTHQECTTELLKLCELGPWKTVKLVDLCTTTGSSPSLDEPCSTSNCSSQNKSGNETQLGCKIAYCDPKIVTANRVPFNDTVTASCRNTVSQRNSVVNTVTLLCGHNASWVVYNCSVRMDSTIYNVKKLVMKRNNQTQVEKVEHPKIENENSEHKEPENLTSGYLAVVILGAVLLLTLGLLALVMCLCGKEKEPVYEYKEDKQDKDDDNTDKRSTQTLKLDHGGKAGHGHPLRSSDTLYGVPSIQHRSSIAHDSVTAPIATMSTTEKSTTAKLPMGSSLAQSQTYANTPEPTDSMVSAACTSKGGSSMVSLASGSASSSGHILGKQSPATVHRTQHIAANFHSPMHK